MLRIAVCDDDSKCKETTKQLLQEYFSKQSEIPAKINGFSSGEELLEDISTKIEDLTNDINSKKENIVAFKQAIGAAEKPLEELADVEEKVYTRDLYHDN